MKRIISIACLVVVMLSVSVFSGATTYTFEPADNDLWDLDHGYKYEWGIGWQLPEDQEIVSASLVFNDIRNWNSEDNDLWVHLLDLGEDKLGAQQLSDPVSGQIDAFDGQGELLHQWHNLPADSQDITYTFSTDELVALMEYSADGYFGFGFDPDCHFYNNGISLIIDTKIIDPVSSVPESTTLLLLGSGMLGLIGFRKNGRK